MSVPINNSLSYEEKVIYLMLNSWSPIKKVRDQWFYWETPDGDFVTIDVAIAIATGAIPWQMGKLFDEEDEYDDY
jgi:hypothetical protein